MLVPTPKPWEASTRVASGPSPVQVTSIVTTWVSPKVSRTVHVPETGTLLRLAVLVWVTGQAACDQPYEEPSGQTAWYCTRAVGSASAVSGDSKS